MLIPCFLAWRPQVRENHDEVMAINEPEGRREEPRRRRPGRTPGVTDEAIERIRETIASGEWGPGVRLPRESELAPPPAPPRHSPTAALPPSSLAPSRRVCH